MSPDLTPFDPSKLVDEVRTRVQATFALMIPEEEWRRLVEREIKAFLTSTEDRYSNRQPSGLSKLVTAELDTFFRQRIKDELAKPEWSTQWGTTPPKMSEEVKRLMIEHAPAIFAATFGAMFQQVIESLKFQR